MQRFLDLRIKKPGGIAGFCLRMICKTREQRAIWDRIEALIEMAPKDGIGAEGGFSESVYVGQRLYLDGLRAGRLAAINVLKSQET